ncbi:nucleoside hydrolase [Maribacter hydrothermalis]|uniref:Nucleoside hydrolase n=1 Tax=Maribacter hydrothermalis TaxID=1836467 RepID=A0A1B7ZCD5_9FLAO|nr:nucleoside hydrolase [Maribacter hydrothermalis]APQ18042.1 nucleoside hydrolase [Maribacter hydrothermalis]OBR40584.1 nucleoside hydrolase [Maribacter hydrothermalis]
MKSRIFSSYLVLLSLLIFGIAHGQKDIIVDADTGNEVDDLYALARILIEPTVNVIALNAAHWQTSHWAVENSMENSHRLNQQLLGEMGLSVKTNRGAIARMYDWGDQAQHSAAAYEIIKQAKQHSEERKLPILVLGALTNVASALFIDPSIASKIKVHWLGTTMDFEHKILKRNDFNCAMDQFALDYLLESSVEMTIMPVSVASAMHIDFELMKTKIEHTSLGKFLNKRWYDHIDSGRRNRVLWDLALITTFIYPEMGKLTTVKTSRDSGNREINFYESVDAPAIYEDFYLHILQFSKN